MMNKYASTRQVAQRLKMRPDTLVRAVWQGTVNPPSKSPSGAYLWTERDIESAACALHRTAFLRGVDHD